MKKLTTILLMPWLGLSAGAAAEVYLNSYEIRCEFETQPKQITGLRGALFGKFSEAEAMVVRAHLLQNLRSQYPPHATSRELPFTESYARAAAAPPVAVERGGAFGARVIHQTQIFKGPATADVAVLSDRPHGAVSRRVTGARLEIGDSSRRRVRYALKDPNLLLSQLAYESTANHQVRVTLPPTLRLQLGKLLRASPRISADAFAQLRVRLELADGHVESHLLEVWPEGSGGAFKRYFFLGGARFFRPAFYRVACARWLTPSN